jgi:LCP family protein required for cell wall assembly
MHVKEYSTRMSGKVQHKKSRNKKTVAIAAIALGAALLAICGVFVYRTVINPVSVFKLPPKIRPMSTKAAGVSPGQGEVQHSEDGEFMQGRVNILVMGMDSSAERVETKREDFRTDTMLLVTINFNTGKVDMITTPRDSYVTVTNATGELYKVNSAAYFGGGLCDSGFKNACDTISGVFGGIPVPYYIGVDMDGMKALIDAMGGVDYDVDLDFTGDSGQKYKKGFQHLDSTQVMDYLRLRKGFGTDADRQARQRRMLISIFKQLARTGQIKNLPKIYQALSDMVYTNLTFEQICALAVFGAGFDDWENIGEYTLPGEYHTAYGVYYYLLDQQAKADLVEKIFGVTIGIDEKHDIRYVLRDSGKKEADKEKKHQNGNDEPDDPEPVMPDTEVPDTGVPDTETPDNTEAPDEEAPGTTSTPEPSGDKGSSAGDGTPGDAG